MPPLEGPRPVADPARLAALSAELVRLGGADAAKLRLGVAVSGGPDSMALLHLLQHLTLSALETATVDHGLRAGAAAEAAMVAQYCGVQGVPHRTLKPATPLKTSLQAAARTVRYALLEEWRLERGLDFILTAHHADDQAETLIMRLNRGSGIGGLSGIRARNGTVLRPLLNWRRAELDDIVRHAGLPTVTDPSNRDVRFDRSRVRAALATAQILDPPAAQLSAALISDANDALDWAAMQVIANWPDGDDHTVMRDGPWPAEIGWRILHARLVGFHGNTDPNQKQLLAAIAALRCGKKCSLGPVLLTPDRKHPSLWRLALAPPRR